MQSQLMAAETRRGCSAFRFLGVEVLAELQAKTVEKRVRWVIEEPKEVLRARQRSMWLKRQLAANLPRILRRFLDDMSPKSIAHMRFVMEVLGMAVVEEPKKKGKGSVEKMWEELEARDTG